MWDGADGVALTDGHSCCCAAAVGSRNLVGNGDRGGLESKVQLTDANTTRSEKRRAKTKKEYKKEERQKRMMTHCDAHWRALSSPPPRDHGAMVNAVVKAFHHRLDPIENVEKVSFEKRERETFVERWRTAFLVRNFREES